YVATVVGGDFLGNVEALFILDMRKVSNACEHMCFHETAGVGVRVRRLKQRRLVHRVFYVRAVKDFVRL
ncbi:hypothetical protein, partial [Obesumbacterium proteus]|uniref:hypothetical protein n=1 Tax=Obesumbacterium proteus TaxID=82983 RepID=UPI00242B3F98